MIKATKRWERKAPTNKGYQYGARRKKPAPRKKASKKKAVRRPVRYSPEVAEKICARIVEGQSLRQIAKRRGMPCTTTIVKWLADERLSAFTAHYARAREAAMERMAEEIIKIADDSEGDITVDEDGNEHINHENVARSRLRVDTRKWTMSKLAPRKYGDKLDLTVEDKAPMTPEARKARIMELEAMRG